MNGQNELSGIDTRFSTSKKTAWRPLSRRPCMMACSVVDSSVNADVGSNNSAAAVVSRVVMRSSLVTFEDRQFC